MTFFNRLYNIVFSSKEIDPAHAYDIWSLQYDNQPDNLILELDEKLVTDMLKNISIKDRIVVDIGCGTGRHWTKILQQHPSRIIGYDVSAGMLKILKQKFPNAEAHLVAGDQLTGLQHHSIDILISTLTIAHFENIGAAMAEWDRILKSAADILITDYHPEILSKGGKRTFRDKGKTVAVKNHIHFIEIIQKIAGQLHWRTECLTEITIDDSMKPWYEKQNVVTVFEKFKGTPVIYGLHLKKMN